MIRQIINILLLIPLLGLSFSALALSTTPLDGPYHFFETTQSYSVATHLTLDNSKSGSFGYSGCHSFFDVENDHLTYDTSVDNKCMWNLGTQGSGWVWYQDAADGILPWSDGVDGPLYNNFSNLLIFAITETNGNQTKKYDKVIAVTQDGNFVLESEVVVEKNIAAISITGNTLIDEMKYKLGLALQSPPDGTLSVTSLTGRYLIRIESHEVGCSHAGGTLDNCSRIYKESETEYLEVIFDGIDHGSGNGYCTVPIVSDRNGLQLIDENFEKTILFSDDKIYSTTGGNADEGSNWVITDCKYTVTGNILAITIEEQVTGEPEEESTMHLTLSSNAEYFKYEGGTVQDNNKEIPSYFGMKMHTALELSDIGGRTYLVTSIDVTDYDYNIDINNPYDLANDYGDAAGNLSVYDARRYALTFGATLGQCTFEQVYDFNMAASLASGKLEMVIQKGTITPTCSYFIDSSVNNKRLKITIDGDTGRKFTAYFSDDFNVIRLDQKFVTDPLVNLDPAFPGWEYDVSSIRFASAFGVLLDGTYVTPSLAINAWVDPKHWVNIKPPVLVPVITYLLF